MFLFFPIVFVTACHPTNNKTSGNTCMQKDSTYNKEESFDEFCGEFFSDSMFQMSRIIFPLPSSVADTTLNDVDTLTYPVFRKENWVILKDNLFSGKDTITGVDGNVYIRRIHKTNTSVDVMIYIEDSGCFTNWKFVLKRGKWYLVNYVESND